MSTFALQLLIGMYGTVATCHWPCDRRAILCVVRSNQTQYSQSSVAEETTLYASSVQHDLQQRWMEDYRSTQAQLDHSCTALSRSLQLFSPPEVSCFLLPETVQLANYEFSLSSHWCTPQYVLFTLQFVLPAVCSVEGFSWAVLDVGRCRGTCWVLWRPPNHPSVLLSPTTAENAHTILQLQVSETAACVWVVISRTLCLFCKRFHLRTPSVKSRLHCRCLI